MTLRTPVMLAASLLLSYIHAQVLCVTCVDQNAPITTGVTNLITNGGFEDTPCPPSGGVIGEMSSFCPASAGYVCDLEGWTCTGGGINTYACISDANYTTIIEGINAVYMGNYYCQGCPSNDTLCLSNDGCVSSAPPDGYPTHTADYGGTTGISLEQTISGLTVGDIYALEFWAGGENQGDVRGLFAVDVGFGRIYLRCWWTDGFNAHQGTRYTIYFTASATDHTVRFTNWGHIVGAASELILDDVKLYDAGGSTTIPCATSTTELSGNNEPTVVGHAGQWTVSAPGPGAKQLVVYDMTGRALLQRGFNAQTVIGADELPAGAWLCTVRDAQGGLWSRVQVNER